MKLMISNCTSNIRYILSHKYIHTNIICKCIYKVYIMTQYIWIELTHLISMPGGWWVLKNFTFEKNYPRKPNQIKISTKISWPLRKDFQETRNNNRPNQNRTLNDHPPIPHVRVGKLQTILISTPPVAYNAVIHLLT